MMDGRRHDDCSQNWGSQQQKQGSNQHQLEFKQREQQNLVKHWSFALQRQLCVDVFTSFEAFGSHFGTHGQCLKWVNPGPASAWKGSRLVAFHWLMQQPRRGFDARRRWSKRSKSPLSAHVSGRLLGPVLVRFLCCRLPCEDEQRSVDGGSRNMEIFHGCVYPRQFLLLLISSGRRFCASLGLLSKGSFARYPYPLGWSRNLFALRIGRKTWTPVGACCENGRFQEFQHFFLLDPCWRLALGISHLSNSRKPRAQVRSFRRHNFRRHNFRRQHFRRQLHALVCCTSVSGVPGKHKLA